MGLTKQVLRRPVTTLLVVLCLIVFGLSSITSSKLELIPEMEMPMLIISAVYPGADPDNVEELVVKLIEDEVGTLSGVDSIMSMSSENFGMVMLSYEYGQDMDKAYDDLKKRLDGLANEFPDDVKTPTIIEMDINATASLVLAINNKAADNLYDYVDTRIVPELEKLGAVASVDVSGGQEQYIKVELIPEKLSQYHLSMNAVSGAISSADFSMPIGDTIVGGKKLSVTAGVTFDTVALLRKIPITLGNGNVIYMEDVANIYSTLEEKNGIGRYNGEDTIAVSVKKNQDSSDMEVSRDVLRTLDRLKAEDENLEVIVVNDYSDSIVSSLESVAQTMIMAVIVSMVIIFLFFGDIKASLIVGTSIPISILAALILMKSMGFSLNVITLSSLVLGVGMMVDNSIVVLESCFRATADSRDKGALAYSRAALEGTGIVLNSIIGSTVTTCVVFLPLASISGMTGQMFKPLGYTVVFCMLASLISAMTIVPLCYLFYKPTETGRALMNAPVERLQRFYRRTMDSLLNHRALVMLASVGILAGTVVMASGMETELMTSDDTGTVSVSIETRPGLLTEKVHDALNQAEAVVAASDQVESYMLRFNSDSGTITAYLSDSRTMDTEDVADLWQKEMDNIENCSIDVSASASMSFMGRQRGYQVLLHGTQYDELKETADKIVQELTGRTDVINVHSSVENTAPIVTIKVDPVMAKAYGMTASGIGSSVRQMLSGVEATTLTVDGEDLSVQVEYPEGEYRTVSQVEDIILTTPKGGFVALSDVAEVIYKDSPSSISKTDKAYEVRISADYTGGNVKALVDSEVVSPNLTGTITLGTNSRDRMMQEEFSSLYRAIALAVFLVFVVMSAQFESPKFSFMVMTTIPFSLVGSFGLLKLAGVSVSMTSLLGFLVLVGTVVNNGILYVDTVNQYRQTMDMRSALIEAGATRIRPILMTSLTTILSMIPMAMGIGSSGSTTQGLAVVDIGGLTAGVAVALFMLPVYYGLLSRRHKEIAADVD